MPLTHKLNIIENPSEDAINTVLDGLKKFNESEFQDLDELSYAVSILDSADSAKGGLTAIITKDCLFVKFFWLDDQLRGLGLGKQALTTIEQKAIELGVKQSYLDTYTFQAPEFYLSQGYVEVGRYTDYPKVGVDKVFFQKRLIAQYTDY